jgi:hypothetical protein
VRGPAVSDVRFASITARSTTTCALTEEGAAFCWGGGGHSQPPVWEVPTPVAGPLTFAALTAGSTTWGEACGITLDGEIHCIRGAEVRALEQDHRWTEIRLGGWPEFTICGFTVERRFLCWGEHNWGRYPALGFPLIRAPAACSWIRPGLPGGWCYPSPTPVFGVVGQEWP